MSDDQMKNALVANFVLWAVMVLAVTYARNFEIVSWDDQFAKWTMIVWFGYTVGLLWFWVFDENIEDDGASPVVSDDPRDGLPIK